MDYIIVFSLVVLSGCFSGLTLGFFSLNLTSLERKIKLGDAKAIKVYPIRKDGNLLLCTLLLGNVAVNSALAIFLGNIATGIIAGVVSTGLIVVFGEIIPQAVFSRFALTLGASTVWMVKLFIFLLYPIAYPLSWALDKALGEELGTIWSKKELEEIIRYHEDADNSEIDEDEERILLGALAYSDMTAEMIVTPKSVVFMLPQGSVLNADLIEVIKEKGYSRIPVHADDNPDKILGMLLIKDLLGIDFTNNQVVSSFMRSDLLLINKDMLLDDLLNHFLTSKNHLACVFNSFAIFIGVVSLEDVIEEILKTEIVDEIDKVRDLRLIAKDLVNKEILK